MTWTERGSFIREKLKACDRTMYLKKGDWELSIGEIEGLLQEGLARYQEPALDVLRIVYKHGNLRVVVWKGTISGNFEPLCAILHSGDTGDLFGFYYQAL